MILEHDTFGGYYEYTFTFCRAYKEPFDTKMIDFVCEQLKNELTIKMLESNKEGK